MDKVTLKWFNEHIIEIFNGECPKAYYCVHENTEVNYGDESDCNLAYCAEHGIEAFMMRRGGGTIVCSKGNIGVSVITPTKWGWLCDKFLEAFKSYLAGRGIAACINHNDILIDGYKVASCVEQRIGDNLERIYSTYQLSVNQDIDAIEHICQKKMEKVPKALSDYGITTTEVENWCNDFFDSLIAQHG